MLGALMAWSLKIYFYLMRMGASTCMYVHPPYMYHVCVVPEKARRGRRIPWSWSPCSLQATLHVLGLELGSFARAVSAHHSIPNSYSFSSQHFNSLVQSLDIQKKLFLVLADIRLHIPKTLWQWANFSPTKKDRGHKKGRLNLKQYQTPPRGPTDSHS